jgi:hypothetical protein
MQREAEAYRALKQKRTAPADAPRRRTDCFVGFFEETQNFESGPGQLTPTSDKENLAQFGSEKCFLA